MNVSTERANVVDERIDERDGTALNVAELFLKDALSRAADATDSCPYPGGGDVVGVFVEFVAEERLPEAVVDFGSALTNDPVFGGLVLERGPPIASDADESKDSIAELVN